MAASTSRSTPLFPAGTGAFLRRRAAELTGLALVGAGAALAAALLTFSAADPSFNTAAPGPVQNAFGVMGASAADLLFQGMGLGAALAPLALLAWGWRLMLKRTLPKAGFKVILLVLAMGAAAVALAGLPVHGTWPFVTGLGGLTGDLASHAFTSLAGQLAAGSTNGPGISTGGAAWTAAVFAPMALGFFIAALGYSLSDWRQVFGTAYGGMKSAAHIGKSGVSRLSTWRKKRALGDEDGERDLFSDPAPGLLKRGRKRTTSEADAREAGPGVVPRATGLVVPPAPKPKPGRKAAAQRQATLALEPATGFHGPPLDLLAREDEENAGHDPEHLAENAALLASVLDDFGVRGEIVKVRPGPVVTLYELEPAPGTKTARVVGLADDIARSMSAISVRVAVVPGRSVIGIELPNSERETVRLRELLASSGFEKTRAQLPLALGKDIGGQPVVADLAAMPHLLIAGTTGSGKSVAMNAMVLSLLYRHSPDVCRLIMIDPKMLELSVYEGIPHLLTPVVTDPKQAVVALKWTVREMEDRYRAMSQLGVRNVAAYNARLRDAQAKGEELTRRVQTGFDAEGKPVFEEQVLATDPLPFIVVVVDEMADLMLVAGKDVEAAIQRLAQMARAAGIHLIMATQRPSVDVITGTIKANFPTRVSFQVTSKIDSRTILGEQGAEQLLGRGDMLYMSGGGRIARVHGPFVTDEEVETVVQHLKAQAEPEYIEEVTRDPEAEMSDGGDGAGSGDPLYEDAVALVASEGKASTSFIQRRFQIGYNRAARLIEQMEQEGLVSPADRVGRREVLMGR